MNLQVAWANPDSAGMRLEPMRNDVCHRVVMSKIQVEIKTANLLEQ